jgi:hypothetical protein
MSKLNERLTLVANLSVVAGIVFLAAEMRQNTQAIQAQTRDSITEKQMTWAGWIGTNRESADVYTRGNAGLDPFDEPGEATMYTLLVGGMVREWENSHYQYQRGLFTPDEFQARTVRWQRAMRLQGYRDYWVANRDAFAPSFRAEIDRIVAEVEAAQ